MLKPSVPSVLKAYNENTICEAGKTIILTYARLKGDTDSVDASAGFGVGREERGGGDLNFCVRGSLSQGKNCDDGGEGEATAAAVLGST